MQYDVIETFQKASIQHGKSSDRIYLMHLGNANPDTLASDLIKFARKKNYTKIFAKIPADKSDAFMQEGYIKESTILNFYDGRKDVVFASFFLDQQRANPESKDEIENIISLALKKANTNNSKKLSSDFNIRKCNVSDVIEMSKLYKEVFETYPFPIHIPQYLAETMETHIDYFGVWQNKQLVALSSAEMDLQHKCVEMTDFATLPSFRGYGFAYHLLKVMESKMFEKNMKTAYTIARAKSPGMNITFAKKGYEFAGTLINNTNISGSIESMNIWYKALL